ncbi:MAG: putative metal-dependent hydrolase [Acidobacteriia bacterium]|nr:putative metal-dependent hydrolase [Terriglobia bacterium]
MSDLQYPVGRFQLVPNPTAQQRATWIDIIEQAPAQVRAAIQSLPPGAIDKPYRPGGWTARQVVHHMADSHMNSYIRFRLALTEDQPTIKPYDEAQWAELRDAKDAPVEMSLHLLDALHARWVVLLKFLTPAQLDRTLYHPENGVVDLNAMLCLYAWHCRHHSAHIGLLLSRRG